MDLPVLDTANARKHMVDSQIRTNRVKDHALLAALRELKRELFVPAQLAAFAYIDEDVALGGGRYLTQPMVIARLIQEAGVRKGTKVLVAASGTGYSAALLALMGADVVALEDDAALGAVAARLLPASVNQVSGSVADGAPQFAPYDVILIDGGVPAIPSALAGQLAANGRILTVIVPPEGAGTAVRAVPGPAGLNITPLFDCQTPVLPALLPKPGFEFI